MGGCTRDKKLDARKNMRRGWRNSTSEK